jgi:ABC-type phosphate transport system ATPase subunit
MPLTATCSTPRWLARAVLAHALGPEHAALAQVEDRLAEAADLLDDGAAQVAHMARALALRQATLLLDETNSNSATKPTRRNRLEQCDEESRGVACLISHGGALRAAHNPLRNPLFSRHGERGV